MRKENRGTEATCFVEMSDSTNLSDTEWTLIEAYFPVYEGHCRPRKHAYRDLVIENGAGMAPGTTSTMACDARYVNRREKKRRRVLRSWIASRSRRFKKEATGLARIFHAYCDFGSGRGTSDEIAGSVSNECQNEFIF